jgi:hypothetical protein
VRSTTVGAGGFAPPLEKDGVVCLFDNGNSIFIKEDVSAMVAEWADSKYVCLKVGMILPLQTGRAERRWSVWAKEWWRAPEELPTVKVGGEGSMLVTGAP